MTIIAHQISKSFQSHLVISPLDLDVKKGTIFGLIGPSGGGKTTIIKLLMGMLASDTGSITVLNKDVPNARLLYEIGYMAQSDALYTDLTGYENLHFFGSMYQLKKEQLQHRINYAASLVDLSGDLSKRVDKYSGGMRRRLSLAIAIIQDPQLLILDEPTVGIDPLLKKKIWTELIKLKNEGKTILVTTHAMDEAEQCDELAMLRDGKIIATGSPEHLKTHYKVQRLDDVFLHAGGDK